VRLEDEAKSSARDISPLLTSSAAASFHRVASTTSHARVGASADLLFRYRCRPITAVLSHPSARSSLARSGKVRSAPPVHGCKRLLGRFWKARKEQAIRDELRETAADSSLSILQISSTPPAQPNDHRSERMTTLDNRLS
jgi:hypothetical protein